MVLSNLTIDSPARSEMFAKDPAIRPMTSWDAARRVSQCLSWIIPVSPRYIQKELPVQQRQYMVNSGDIPASSSRTQAQTLNEWAEYCKRSDFEVFGWIALTALRKRAAMRLPIK